VYALSTDVLKSQQQRPVEYGEASAPGSWKDASPSSLRQANMQYLALFAPFFVLQGGQQELGPPIICLLSQPWVFHVLTDDILDGGHLSPEQWES
jgi:hypothetical protein